MARPATPTFDGDGALFRLVSEAWRLSYAHLFDPYFAARVSEVEPLPHQISAVYGEMLTRNPLRYVLADDPGAGKTVMTGLLIRELIARGDLRRCLIVCPGSLAEQWRDELLGKFHLRFEILDGKKIAAAENVFAETRFAIAGLDTLARNEDTLEKLRDVRWDLVVCDEAHKMSASVNGGKIATTRRFRLGRLLSGCCRDFLLLTATPHNGKEEDFQLFLSLLDRDRFEGATGPVDVSDIMRRLLKEDLLKFDGSPLFPERRAVTLKYSLSEAETALYEAVSEYVRVQFNRADKLDKERRVTVGFALTVLQRRLASSPVAVCRSLERRRERLEKRLAAEKAGQSVAFDYAAYERLDEDETSAAELENAETEIADKASASQTAAELQAEVMALTDLEKMARTLLLGGRDRKWEELSGLLREEEKLRGPDGEREKLLVFTEHRDTLFYLAEKIGSLLGDPDSVVVIHGGLSRRERREAADRFRNDKSVGVLVATDAAGEGLNLQSAHLLVNYDLPWNPNRLEQRFGRIHRIGQTRVCRLWSLVACETREGAVFARLSFKNKPLRELLVEAVRGGDPGRIAETVEEALREELSRELTPVGLAPDPEAVAVLREDMERAAAGRPQPYYIESFFLEAVKVLGGKMVPREKGCYEIIRTPARLRARKGSDPVSRLRVRFDKDCQTGELLCPGHSLFDAVLAAIRERGGDVLERGAVLIDDNDPGDAPRLLYYVNSTVSDESGVIISRRIWFVEISEDGSIERPRYAPYLDYRAPTAEEKKLLPTRVNIATPPPPPRL